MPRRTSGRFKSAIAKGATRFKSSLFKSNNELAYVKQRMTTRPLQGMKAVHDMGLPPTLINAILNGDLKTAQKLGAMGDQGRNIQKLMPSILSDSLDFIEGTSVYNDGMLQIYKRGMQVDTQIKQGSRELGIANLQRTEDLTYNMHKWAYDKQAVRQSAQHAMELLKVNAYLLSLNKEVDHQYSIDNAVNQTRKRILDDRLRYNISALLHMLGYGDNADLSLIAQKDYSNFNALAATTGGTASFGSGLLRSIGDGIRALLPNI